MIHSLFSYSLLIMFSVLTSLNAYSQSSRRIDLRQNLHQDYHTAGFKVNYKDLGLNKPVDSLVEMTEKDTLVYRFNSQGYLTFSGNKIDYKRYFYAGNNLLEVEEVIKDFVDHKIWKFDQRGYLKQLTEIHQFRLGDPPQTFVSTFSIQDHDSVLIIEGYRTRFTKNKAIDSSRIKIVYTYENNQLNSKADSLFNPRGDTISSLIRFIYDQKQQVTCIVLRSGCYPLSSCVFWTQNMIYDSLGRLSEIDFTDQTVRNSIRSDNYFKRILYDSSGNNYIEVYSWYNGSPWNNTLQTSTVIWKLTLDKNGSWVQKDVMEESSLYTTRRVIYYRE